MQLVNRKQSKIGDCEVCDTKNVEVWNEHGNILMCQPCRDRESTLSSKSREAKVLIEESRKIDSSIQTDQEIYNAKTVAAIELYGAIQADDTIPADQKEITFTRECLRRKNHFQEVIFNKREELKQLEQEMRVWQTTGQASAAKLRNEVREEFKAFDIHYQPVKVKTVKPTKIKTPKKSGKVEAQEARDAAKKYNLDAIAIQMIAKARNISAEDAAKFMQKQLEPVTRTN